MFSAPPCLGRDVQAQNCAGLPIHYQGRRHGPKVAGVTGMPSERKFHRVACAATQQRAALQTELQPASWRRFSTSDEASQLF